MIVFKSLPFCRGFDIIRYPLVEVLAQSEPTIGCCSPHETESGEETGTVELSISQTTQKSTMSSTQKSTMSSTVSDPASKPAKKKGNKAADSASQLTKTVSKLSLKNTTEINKSKDNKNKKKGSEDTLEPGCDPLAHCLESKPTGLLFFKIFPLKLFLYCSSGSYIPFCFNIL